MKKNYLLTLISGLVMFLFTHSVKAQQTKIGYFDDQTVLSLFPGIQGKLDTIIQTYVRDTLQEEYLYSLKEYTRKDSLFKLDSANMRPVQRDLELADINKLRYKLVNWQQYQQQILQQKQEIFLRPYEEKIAVALNVIIEKEKYTYVLKADAISPYSIPPIQDNLSIPVAVKLNLDVPKDVLDLYLKAKSGQNIKQNSLNSSSTIPPKKTN